MFWSVNVALRISSSMENPSGRLKYFSNPAESHLFLAINNYWNTYLYFTSRENTYTIPIPLLLLRGDHDILGTHVLRKRSILYRYKWVVMCVAWHKKTNGNSWPSAVIWGWKTMDGSNVLFMIGVDWIDHQVHKHQPRTLSHASHRNFAPAWRSEYSTEELYVKGTGRINTAAVVIICEKKGSTQGWLQVALDQVGPNEGQIRSDPPAREFRIRSSNLT